MSHERDRFVARFNAAVANGLVNFKLFVQDPHTLSEEELFEALNQFDDAIAAGYVTQHPVWQDQTPQRSALLGS